MTNKKGNSRGKATATAKAKATATAKAKANTGILHFVQDDDVIGTMTTYKQTTAGWVQPS
jgi:hypothetical protein